MRSVLSSVIVCLLSALTASCRTMRENSRMLVLSSVTGIDSGPTPEREEEILREMWHYRPELPRQILAQAVGMQGDRSRLERVMAAMIRGNPVKVVLMGGSLSLRGWNYPDESFIRQVHKWLELTFIPGCREEAQRRADKEAARPSPPMWKGKFKGKKDNEDPGSIPSQSSAKKGTVSSDLSTSLPSEDGEWIPERGPRPPTELHSIPSAGYRRDGHLCPTAAEAEGPMGEPRFKIELVNLAVPATGPGYAERCILSRLPEDADLVVMDFGINDFQQGSKLNHPERQAFERIMRRALTLPKSPAVLLFSAYSDYQAHGSFVGKSKEGENLSQNKHALIAEYYGDVQSISVRAAFWQIINAASDDPNKLIYLGRHFLNDLIHVTPYGHRWNADLIISYLRDVATEMIAKRRLSRSLSFLTKDKEGHESDAAAWSWPSELTDSPSCWGGSIVNATHCMIQGRWGRDYFVPYSSPAASKIMTSSQVAIKEPFFLGNEYEPSGVCAVAQEFKDLVTRSEGWAWVDDGKKGKPKLGYSCESVGCELTIEIDISGQVAMMAQVALQERNKVKEAQASKEADWGGGGSGNARLRTHDINAFLIYLSSWRDMGTAEVSCDGSCACEPSRIDALAADMRFRASIPLLHKFAIKEGRVDGKTCLITIEILDETNSEGHKFKVIGLTTSTNDLFHLDYIVREGLDTG